MLLCARGSSCFFCQSCCLGWLALLPKAPDGANNEPPQGPVSLTTRLPLRETPVDVRPGCRQVVRLGQHDTIEHGIEPPIAASVQAMAHKSSGRRLQRRHAGVGGQLRVSREPMTGPKDARQGPGGEERTLSGDRARWRAGARPIAGPGRVTCIRSHRA